MFTFRQVLMVTCWGWAGRARLGSWRAGTGVRPVWSCVVAGRAGRLPALRGCAEQAGERVDCFEEQRVDAGLLVGGAAGAELGDGAAVLGLGGELADPGGHGGVLEGGRAAGCGAASRG